MKGEVEILASSAVSVSDLDEIELQLRQWGLHSAIRRLPPRRGVAELSWLLLLTIPAEIVVGKMVDHLGNAAYQSLRGLVEQVLARYRGAEGDTQPVPSTVVVEAAGTGARFALEADLPLEAYRQLFDEITAHSASDGLRIFDRQDHRWSLSATV